MEYIHCDYKNLNFERGKNKEDFQFPFPVGNYNKFHKSSLEIIVFNCPGGGAISPDSQTPPSPSSVHAPVIGGPVKINICLVFI